LLKPCKLIDGHFCGESSSETVTAVPYVYVVIQYDGCCTVCMFCAGMITELTIKATLANLLADVYEVITSAVILF